MQLYTISNLHLAYQANRQPWRRCRHPEDWLIVAGDIGETEAHLRLALTILTERFARVLWTPGNHDLWTMPSHENDLRGDAKYQRLVAICHEYHVSTPEDPYIAWPGAGPAYRLAPLFILYDYTFRPDHVPARPALAWAEEEGIVCADEVVLHPDPYPTRFDSYRARPLYGTTVASRRRDAADLDQPLSAAPRSGRLAAYSTLLAVVWHTSHHRIGICVLPPQSLYLAISISPAHAGAMGCALKKCRSATRSKGRSGVLSRAICVKFCRNKVTRRRWPFTHGRCVAYGSVSRIISACTNLCSISLSPSDRPDHPTDSALPPDRFLDRKVHRSQRCDEP